MAACRLIHRTGPRTGSRRLPNSTCAGCPRRSPCCEHWRWPTRCVRASACRCSRRCCRRRCSTCGWRAASRQRPPRCPPGVRGWAYVVRWTMTKLRLEQAPVAALPRRFLLTAPLWGMLAGVLLGIDGAAALVSRWNPATLALVHVFALGVLGNVMFGSILQFLPAAGGVRLRGGARLGHALHLLLNLGVALLVAGLHQGWSIALFAAALLLPLAFAILAAMVVPGLARAAGQRERERERERGEKARRRHGHSDDHVIVLARLRNLVQVFLLDLLVVIVLTGRPTAPIWSMTDLMCWSYQLLRARRSRQRSCQMSEQPRSMSIIGRTTSTSHVFGR